MINQIQEAIQVIDIPCLPGIYCEYYTLGLIDYCFVYLYDVKYCHAAPVERPFMGRMFTHSLRSSRPVTISGCFPISRKVPVEAWFKTPAIVRERWRSCLKILSLQTPGKYDDCRLGLSVFAEERAET